MADPTSEAEGISMSASVTLTGGVVADPELKFSAKGMAVLNLRVATSRRTKDGDNWVDVDQTFWRVSAFRQLAENAAESLSKGDRVIVVGKIKSRDWDDKDGNKRTVFEVTADHIGPDLKNATAKPNRVAREKPAAPAEDDPWSKPFMSDDSPAPF